MDRPACTFALGLIALECRYCVGIAENPSDATPIACTKLSGSTHPIFVNHEVCLKCPERNR